MRSTLARLRQNLTTPPAELKWADFTPSGRLLRAGISRLGGHAVTILSRASDDPDIAQMEAQTLADGVEAGRLCANVERGAFLWYLPIAWSGPEGGPGGAIRCLRVTHAVFAEVIGHFNAGRRITPGEMKALFQLTAGASPSVAASLDGVSVETRRAQIKSAAAKLQTAGQVDLVRLLIGQLVHLLSIADPGTAPVSFAERFMSRHFPELPGLHVLRLNDGRVLRFLDLGPRAGVPLVAVHGLMFGMLLDGGTAQLERHNLRLLMPIRPGYLDPRPVMTGFGAGDLVEEGLRQLAVFIEEIAGAPATLVGHSFGAHLATAFRSAHPHLVHKLILASANIPLSRRAARTGAAQLYDGYRKLMTGAGVARAVTTEFARFYATRETCRDILLSMFGSQATDRALISIEPAEERRDSCGWFSDLYVASVAGAADDFSLGISGAAFDGTAGHADFWLQGEEDPLTSPADLRATLGAGVPGIVIPGAGHFASATHTEDFWSAIAAAVS